MKKVVAIFLTLILLIGSFAGCGNKEIVKFEATKPTKGRILVLRNVFYKDYFSQYYSKLRSTLASD